MSQQIGQNTQCQLSSKRSRVIRRLLRTLTAWSKFSIDLNFLKWSILRSCECLKMITTRPRTFCFSPWRTKIRFLTDLESQKSIVIIYFLFLITGTRNRSAGHSRTWNFTPLSQKSNSLAINSKIQQCLAHITWSRKALKWNKEFTKFASTYLSMEIMNQIQKIWKDRSHLAKQNLFMTKNQSWLKLTNILLVSFQVKHHNNQILKHNSLETKVR